MLVAIWIFGLLTVLSACGVVVSKKSLNSALCLVATLFFVAVHFALLGADFLAALQILIYAGAIMILVCFVILLLGLERDADREQPKVPSLFAAIFIAVLFGMLSFVIQDESLDLRFTNYLADKAPVTVAVDGAEPVALVAKSGAGEVGKLMLEKYLVPFELSALLLLAAIIGAVSLAYEPRRPLRQGRGLSAMQDKFGTREEQLISSEVKS
jgi:NADH-quinone oxidoreductase subunit J